MVYRLFSLWHYAIISSHYNHHNICGLCTASTHGSKCRVSRRIKETDHALIGFYVVGTNVLRDTTCFASGNFSAANIVEKGGFTMVNVAHDSNNRSASSWCHIVLHQVG